MRATEFLNEDENLDDLVEACEMWMAFEASTNDVKLILSHPFSQQFKDPAKISKTLTRAFPVNHGDETFNSEAGIISYSENGMKGAAEYYKTLDVDYELVVVEKQLNPADLLLNFTALFLNLPLDHQMHYEDIALTKAEAEIWLKPTQYYTRIDKSEVIGRLG